MRVTLHMETHTLQIQGRTLSSYRALIYCLTQSLDKNALEKVLPCRDENRSEIVNTSVAKSALQQMFGSTFSKLDEFVVNNLVSGLCIKLAAPELPGYSMLLFLELRFLEVALKKLARQQGVEFRKGEGFGKSLSSYSRRYGLDHEWRSAGKVTTCFRKSLCGFSLA